MTGSVMIMMASAGLPGSITTPNVGINNTSSTLTGIRGGSFTLVNDGTLTKVSGVGASSWFTPTTTGIGSMVWVKMTIVSQTLTTIGGTTGSWLSLSSGQTWSFQNSATTTEGFGSFTLSFATDSAGGNVVGSGSGNWDVGYAP